jgi:hypothetical protein
MASIHMYSHTLHLKNNIVHFPRAIKITTQSNIPKSTSVTHKSLLISYKRSKMQSLEKRKISAGNDYGYKNNEHVLSNEVGPHSTCEFDNPSLIYRMK